MAKPRILASILLMVALLSSVVSGCSATTTIPDITEKERQAIIAQTVSYQTEGSVYRADSYTVTKLKRGDIIYGMLPGQSAFYADQATINAGK